ncbi:MAG: Ig-like domain repeat protein [Acidobacteriaceae bacterium]|nr:Ig-like domain repeat protein [Acidobacteriaceae bacterium]
MIRVKEVFKRIKVVGCAVLAGATAFAAEGAAQAQSTPLYLISQTTAVNAAATAGYGTPIGNMVADKFGNVYAPDLYASRVLEFPANGGAAIVVFSEKNPSTLVGGVGMDASGALYVTLVYGPAGATDSGVYRLPLTTSGIQPYVYTGAAPPICTAGATTACTYGNFVQTAGYYYFGQAIAFDGTGNGYFAMSGGGIGANVILQCNAACASDTGNASVYLNSLPSAPTSIAASAGGDLYWVDGHSVYYSKSASGTYSVFDGTLGAATGVSFDRAGNLYVSGGAGTYEYPLISGVLVSSSKFLVSNQTSTAGPAIDNNGNIFTAPYYGAVMETSLFNANLGSSPVGTAAAPTTLTVNFISPGTIASITASGNTGSSAEYVVSANTCNGAAQPINGSCTFAVTFTPSAVGIRRGGVVITDTAGNTTTAYLTGVGTGTGFAVDPGTPSTVTSALKAPSGMTVDASKSLYVADATAGTVTRYPTGSSTGTVVASSLNKPTGVALDASGNLLVVEQGANDVRVFARSATSSTGFATTSTVFASGLNAPTDVVASGLGVVFVSNTGAHEVRQYPNPSRLPSMSQYASYGISLNAPAGLAVDSQGDLFIADTAGNQVVEISSTGVQTSLGSGLSAPTGVAAEASGSIIIADQGNGRLVRIPYEAAGLTTTDEVVLPQPVVNPYAVRLASDGTLFVSDNQGAVVDSLSRTAGTVNFGISNVNTLSASQAIIVSSTGTNPLTLGTPFYAAVPANTGFTLTAGVVGTPCTSGTLASGADCSLSSTFDPTTTGAKTYAVPFNTTAINTSSPSVTLTGQGVQLVAVNITVAQTPAGAVSYGTSVKLTATVASAGTSTGTPTGNLIFTIDGTAYKAIVLANGQASLTLSSLSTGTHTVVASYGGDATFASGSVTAASIVVNPATTTGTLTIAASGLTPLSAATTDTVTLTTTIMPSIAGTLNGTVTYYTGTTVLGTATVNQTNPVSATYPAGQYAAILTLSGLNPGAYPIYAVFTPAANYTGFTTPAQTLTIVSAPTYGITEDTTTLTASATQYGIANLTVSSYAGFQAGVSLSCSGLPVNSYCIFRPASVSLTSSGTSIPQQLTQMQVRVDQNPTNINSAAGFGLIGGALAFTLLLALRRNHSAKKLVSCSLVFAAVSMTAAMVTACGSSNTPYPTPAGTYTIKLQSTATPLVNGAAPVVYNIARIKVATVNGVNVAHIITTATNSFTTGNVIQISGNSNAAFNGSFTVLGTSVDNDPNDAPYTGVAQVDISAGSVAVGTTSTGGALRQSNVSIPDQTFTLIVK